MLTKKAKLAENQPKITENVNPNPYIHPSSVNKTTEKQKIAKSRTRLIIRYDAGFGNCLFIRGSGANLNWQKGIALHNINRDEWIWETDLNFKSCEFKILFNDQEFETGDNHFLTMGACIQYAPKFAQK